MTDNNIPWSYQRPTPFFHSSYPSQFIPLLSSCPLTLPSQVRRVSQLVLPTYAVVWGHSSAHRWFTVATLTLSPPISNRSSARSGASWAPRPTSAGRLTGPGQVTIPLCVHEYNRLATSRRKHVATLLSIPRLLRYSCSLFLSVPWTWVDGGLVQMTCLRPRMKQSFNLCILIKCKSQHGWLPTAKRSFSNRDWEQH